MESNRVFARVINIALFLLIISSTACNKLDPCEECKKIPFGTPSRIVCTESDKLDAVLDGYSCQPQ